jgi:hypothetical protein
MSQPVASVKRAFQLAKDPLFQRLLFLAGPFSDLGHGERLAKWIERSVDVCLTPCAPFRRGYPMVPTGNWAMVRSIAAM